MVPSMGSHLGPRLGPHLVVYLNTNARCASFLLSDGSNLRIPRVLPVTAAGEAIAACGRRGQGRRSRRSGPLSLSAGGCYPSGRGGGGKGGPTTRYATRDGSNTCPSRSPAGGRGAEPPAGSGAAPRHASPSPPRGPRASSGGREL